MLHDYKFSKPAEVSPHSEGTKQAGGDLWQCHKAERGVWTKPMLTALERGVKGNKWFSLIDKVCHPRTLEVAWEKVERNAGGCGIDNISVEFFKKDSLSRLETLNIQLKEGRYHPQPIKRKYIPKLGSNEKRPLGIPTVRDRVVQTALKMVIEPIFEKEFAPMSYGFRPGRSCKDALREVEKHLRDGFTHVVDVDIKGYFDAIAHDKLMALIEERISDGRVLDLIGKFLKQGILQEGVEIESEKGSPQGGVISPLLANIYLNPLDWLLTEAGYNVVRYADDLVVLAESEMKAQTALQEITAWMEQAGLTLHPEKTKIVNVREHKASFEFLGYKFFRGKNGHLRKVVRDKSAKKLRSSIKRYTKRCNGKSMEEIIRKINPILKGWHGYYQHAYQREFRNFDGWVRMRLRSILRKRLKKKGRGRGKDHQRWKNCYFEERGLYSLAKAHAEQVSLRQRSKLC